MNRQTEIFHFNLQKPSERDGQEPETIVIEDNQSVFFFFFYFIFLFFFFLCSTVTRATRKEHLKFCMSNTNTRNTVYLRVAVEQEHFH